MTEPILRVERLCVSYGAVQAVRDASFRLSKGEIVAIVGPNGAGKSSTLNAIVGLVRSQGEIAFEGRRIDGMATETIVRRGLTLCPEGRRVFPDLTVEENLTLGAIPLARKSERAINKARAFELFPALAERRQQPAGTLSGGEQQMLAISRALMSAPRALLFDEPSLGLAPRIVEQMFELIERLRIWGHSIVLVEQNVGQALAIADRGYVMVNGRIETEGPASALASNSEIQETYFGVG